MSISERALRSIGFGEYVKCFSIVYNHHDKSISVILTMVDDTKLTLTQTQTPVWSTSNSSD